MKSTVITVPVRRMGPSTRDEQDWVAVEEPLEIKLGRRTVAITMRTPGNDFELAVGFLHGEGLLGEAPVREVRYCANGSAVDTGFNIVTVTTDGSGPEPSARLATTTSSCGLCGAEAIDELADRLEPIAPGSAATFDLALLADLPKGERSVSLPSCSTRFPTHQRAHRWRGILAIDLPLG